MVAINNLHNESTDRVNTPYQRRRYDLNSKNIYIETRHLMLHEYLVRFFSSVKGKMCPVVFSSYFFFLSLFTKPSPQSLFNTLRGEFGCNLEFSTLFCLCRLQHQISNWISILKICKCIGVNVMKTNVLRRTDVMNA